MAQPKTQQEKILERIKGFCLFDDEFMAKVFENDKERIELLLHIILGRDDLRVLEARTQYDIRNLRGHSIRMDIHAIDSENVEYNIEVQRLDQGADVKRARYNSSLMDANSLKKGEDYNQLRETYVIFITENDVLEGNLPIYNIERTIQQNGKLFGDEEHIIYVNGAYQDDTPLGKLMKDFKTSNPNDMHYNLLAQRARYLKEDEKGVAEMSTAVAELIEDEKRESAIRMLSDGITVEKVAVYLELPVEQVKEISKTIEA